MARGQRLGDRFAHSWLGRAGASCQPCLRAPPIRSAAVPESGFSPAEFHFRRRPRKSPRPTQRRRAHACLRPQNHARPADDRRPCRAAPSPAAMPMPTARPCASPSPSRSACIRASWATTPWSIWRRRISPARCPTCVAPPKPPPKPIDVAALPEIKLRAGAYANFTRLVFDWPHDCSLHVFPGAGKMTVRFQAPVRPDLSAIARFAPPWVKNAAWHIDGSDHRGRIRDRHRFRLSRFQGRHQSRARYSGAQDRRHRLCAARHRQAASHRDQGGAKPAASTAPGARPSPTPPASLPAPKRAKPPQRRCQKPDAKTADPQSRDAKPRCQAGRRQSQPLPSPPPPCSPPPAALHDVQVTDSRLTQNGAILTFKGAGAHAQRRLHSRPDRLGGAGKRAQLRRRQLEDRSWAISPPGWKRRPASGISILRITLKQPAQIAARSNRRRPESGDRRRRQRLAHRHRLCPQPGRSQARLAHHLAARRRSSASRSPIRSPAMS